MHPLRIALLALVVLLSAYIQFSVATRTSIDGPVRLIRVTASLPPIGPCACHGHAGCTVDGIREQAGEPKNEEMRRFSAGASVRQWVTSQPIDRVGT
jgi:hypothetical protein